MRLKIIKSIAVIIVFFWISACNNEAEKNDTTKPKIELLGEHEIVLQGAEEYKDFKDPGAVASDDLDGNITSDIKVFPMGASSSSNDEEVYVFMYTVKDKAGNRAKPQKRIIRVLKKD
jgi:hypothetical protein